LGITLCKPFAAERAAILTIIDKQANHANEIRRHSGANAEVMSRL
jgi:hypothetical protein